MFWTPPLDLPGCQATVHLHHIGLDTHQGSTHWWNWFARAWCVPCQHAKKPFAKSRSTTKGDLKPKYPENLHIFHLSILSRIWFEWYWLFCIRLFSQYWQCFRSIANPAVTTTFHEYRAMWCSKVLFDCAALGIWFLIVASGGTPHLTRVAKSSANMDLSLGYQIVAKPHKFR